MGYSAAKPEVGVLYFASGAAEALTVGATRTKVANYTGAIDPNGGDGLVVATAGTADRVVVNKDGWYRVAYHISGSWGGAADGATFSVTAGAGTDSVADGDVIAGSESSYLTVDVEDAVYSAETYVYLQANSYVTLCQVQLSAGGTFTVDCGSLIVERISD